VNSPGWDLCTEWVLLHSGRGRLSQTDPIAWFSEEELSLAPVGLVAEVLASAQRMDDFTRLVATSAAARAHVLRVPCHVFGAGLEEWELIDKCLDIARRLEAREAAWAAVRQGLEE
jgi:hypothetical protein